MQDKFNAKINKIFLLMNDNFPSSPGEVMLISGHKRKQTLDIVSHIESLLVLLYAIKKQSDFDLVIAPPLRDPDEIGFDVDLKKLVQIENYSVMTLYSAIGNREVQTDVVPFRQMFTLLLKTKLILSFSDNEKEVIASIVDVLDGDIPLLPDVSKDMVNYHFKYEPIVAQNIFSDIIKNSGLQPELDNPSTILDVLVYMIGHRRFDEKFNSLISKANSMTFAGFDRIMLKMINKMHERAIGATI